MTDWKMTYWKMTDEVAGWNDREQRPNYKHAAQPSASHGDNN